MGMWSTRILFILAGLMPLVAFAQEHEAGHEAGIPWRALILPQAVNLLLFAGVLIYFLREPVAQYFTGKVDDFEKSKREAEQAKLAAQKEFTSIQERLQELERTATKTLQTAKVDASNLREKIIQEAHHAAAKLEGEAELFAGQELQRAVFSLRTELLNKSVEIAQGDLKAEQSPETDRQLRHQFVEKVQRVNL